MKLIMSLILFLFSWTIITAQEEYHVERDSIEVFDESPILLDSLTNEGVSSLVVDEKVFSPNPNKAILYSAVFPGLGQIYNRKYWKLPIIAGGFLGCAYAISWNGKTYNGYRDAHKSFIDGDPDTNLWQDYIMKSRQNSIGEGWEDINNWSESLKQQQENDFIRAKDFHRRNRDLSYIVTVGLYALCIIDAYVDAQLFHFDISEDLSLRVDPAIMPQSPYNSYSLGFQCSLKF